MRRTAAQPYELCVVREAETGGRGPATLISAGHLFGAVLSEIICAKEFVRQSPELKESFSSAATAAKTLAKEQAEALSAEESALGKIKSQLTAFRVK